MKSLNRSIRDLIFSSKCSICRERCCDKDSYLCYNCYEKIAGKIKLHRRGNLYYTTYYDRDIKKLIASFKLKRRRYIGVFIGKLVGDLLRSIVKEEEIDIVIPVPVSSARRRERGYNQVEDILEHAGIAYKRLKRIRNTQPMHKLKDEKLRRENVLGSFQGSLSIEGRNILIVDDIVTTGSTIKEVISSLERDGSSKKVVVFAFALANTALASDLAF